MLIALLSQMVAFEYKSLIREVLLLLILSTPAHIASSLLGGLGAADIIDS